MLSSYCSIRFDLWIFLLLGSFFGCHSSVVVEPARFSVHPGASVVCRGRIENDRALTDKGYARWFVDLEADDMKDLNMASTFEYCRNASSLSEIDVNERFFF